MKKIFSILFCLSLLFAPLSTVFAYDFIKDTGLSETTEGAGYDNSYLDASPGGEGTVSAIVINIIQLILGFVGIIFFMLILYSGYLWMTASGNEQQIEKAKKILTNAIIGVGIVLSAYAFSYFIVGAFSQGRIK